MGPALFLLYFNRSVLLFMFQIAIAFFVCFVATVNYELCLAAGSSVKHTVVS